ncbi:hypothetical protein [Ideonella sp.]|uniref:rolling circle replication-associated protein n=1 Tax=Ideonella sp. TaxID=1929293 RepID=UPI0035AF6D95
MTPSTLPRDRDGVPFRPGAPWFHVRDAFTDEGRAILETEWERVSEGMRDAFANSFSPLTAEAYEAATVAGHGARQGAGLVSVSTTGPKGTRRKAPLSPVSFARAKKRADDTPGVYMPPADEDSARVRKLRRAVGFAARAQGVAKKGHRPDDVLMVTLTYRNGGDWRPDHVGDCLRRARKWLQRRGIPCRYVWVAELQKRGVIHYHIGFWVPHGFRLPMFDACGWWPHGMTNVEKARNAVPYLMKYLSKGSDRAGCWRLPQGARMYGIGGVEHALRRARRWLGLPAFVQARSDIADDWRRAPGGGWVDPDGVIWASEWRRAKVGPYLAFERVADHGRPFEAHGPFSWIGGAQ